MDLLKDEIKYQSYSCGFCKKSNSVLKCSKCKLIYYCDRNCQVKDWKNHKLVCKK